MYVCMYVCITVCEKMWGWKEEEAPIKKKNVFGKFVFLPCEAPNTFFDRHMYVCMYVCGRVHTHTHTHTHQVTVINIRAIFLFKVF